MTEILKILHIFVIFIYIVHLFDCIFVFPQQYNANIMMSTHTYLLLYSIFFMPDKHIFFLLFSTNIRLQNWKL